MVYYAQNLIKLILLGKNIKNLLQENVNGGTLVTRVDSMSCFFPVLSNSNQRWELLITK